MVETRDMLFKALADPTRRALFERLCEQGEQTVGMLTAQAGVSQPAVSKHLAILRQAGLVLDRQQGRPAHYRPRPAAPAPLAAWTGRMTLSLNGRLDDLANTTDRT